MDITAGTETNFWSADNPPLDGSGLYSYEDFCNAPVGFAATDTGKITYPALDEGLDAYNPSGVAEGIILVRTEKAKGAYDAVTRFCRLIGNSVFETSSTLRRPWEDPTIQVERDAYGKPLYIATGVHVEWNIDDPTIVDRFYTEIYGGPSIGQMVYWGQSVDGHKDMRANSMAVMLRPQCNEFDQGKMTYVALEDTPGALEDALRSGQPTRRYRSDGPGKEIVLDELTRSAQFVGAAGIFASDTWGGPNSLINLGNGWNFVASHVATAIPGLPPDYRIYDGFNMLHRPASNQVHIFRPHLSVNDFPPSESKTEALRRVFFTGGVHDVQVTDDYGISGRGTGGIGDKEMCRYGFHSVKPLGGLMLS